MSTSAELALETTEDAVVARVSGEVDMTNARWLGEELARSVPNEALAVVMELSDTTYLDSAGIELVFDLARRLRRRRQQLRVVLPESSPLRRVLEVTDVASVASIHPSLEEGLRG